MECLGAENTGAAFVGRYNAVVCVSVCALKHDRMPKLEFLIQFLAPLTWCANRIHNLHDGDLLQDRDDSKIVQSTALAVCAMLGGSAVVEALPKVVDEE